MAPRRVEVDHIEADAVLAHQLQLRQRREDRLVQDLESGDRLAVTAKELHQRRAA
jgi:hypothetical protein